MAIEQNVFGVATALASVASIPVSYGLFRMVWALRLHPEPPPEEARGRLYRLSDRRRRDRLGLTFSALCVGLALAAMLLIAAPWRSDITVRASCGVGFLLVIWGCIALFGWRLKSDRARGLIIGAESVTVLMSHGEERLLKSQIAGLQLAEGRAAALEGSGLPWLQQIGQVILKSSDPDAADLTLPATLAVDAAFDEWAGSLPVLGSPLLDGRGELTVRDAGAFATVRRQWAEEGYARGVLFWVFLLVLCLQLLLSLERAPDGHSLNDAYLLALGGARADLVFEEGEWFRLISAAFLHRDASHFSRSVPLLAIMALYLERSAGSLQFLAVFLISAAASSLASLFLAPPEFVTVGASGAMFGVLGCYLGGHVRPQITSTNPWLLLVLSLGALAAALPPGQLPYLSHSYFGPDYGGNLAGLIAGVMTALALAMIPRRSPRMVASSPPPGL